MKKLLLILSLMLFFVPSHAQEEITPPIFRPKPFEREFEATMQQHKIDGVMVLMMEKGEVVYLEGVGTNAAGEPFDLETTYPLGRLADMFITTTVMMLHEQELVDETTPINNYFPELNFDPIRSILLRQLLNHSAGLGTAELAPLDKISEITAEDSEYFAGNRFSYCTRCYGLLVHLVEMMNGKPYDELLSESIFYPLHMDNTVVEAGQIYTTPEDMTHWLGMLLQNGRWDAVQLIKPDTIRDMQKARIPTNRSANEHYGYGWFVQKNLGLGLREPERDIMATVYDLGEYRAQMTIVPHYQRGILLLTDQPTTGLNPLMAVAVEHFMGWTAPEFTAPETLTGFTGVFRTEGKVELIIREATHGLEVEYAGQTVPLTRMDVYQFDFMLDDQRGTIFFDFRNQGSLFTLTLDGITQVFSRRI